MIRTIKTYIMIMIFIAMLVTAFIFYAAKDYKNSYLVKLDKELMENTEEYSEFISGEFSNIMVSIESLGKVFSNTDFLYSPEIQDVFKHLNENMNVISSIYFIYDSDGSGVNSSGYLSIKDIGHDLRQRQWYINALNSSGAVLTNVYKDVRQDKPVITISYPVYEGSELKGVLGADMFLDNINDKFQFMTTWLNTYLYVLDSSGNILLHPSEINIGLSFANPNYEKNKELGISDEYFKNNHARIWKDDFSKNHSGTVIYENSGGTQVYAYYERIEKLGWVIVSAYEYNEIENDTFKFYLWLILLGIFVTLILGSILYYALVWSNSRHKVTRTYTTNKLAEIMANRAREESKFILLYIDIVDFSSINSNYGRDFGDKVLLKFAKTIKGLVKKDGILATSQYCNFIFVFNKNEWKDALKFTLELKSKLDRLSVRVNDTTLILNSFLGLTKLNLDDKNIIEQGINSVCELFYELKKTTSENPLIYSDFSVLIKEKEKKEKLKNELLSAIHEDRIVPFYQPIYNLKLRKIDKFEILMRIKYEDKFLSPFQYICIAEEYNLIEVVDFIVIEKALEYKNKVDKSDEVGLSINISGKVLHDYKFLNKIAEKVDEFNIKHSNITFEITETYNVSNIDKLAEIVNYYRKLEFKFSIDDFGSGFSSMYYLKCIPANYVKIDGSFIKDISVNKESYFVVESIISMAKAFRIKTIAEFVENQEINQIIKKMGIDYGQGYFYGKPEQYFRFQNNEDIVD